MTGNVSTTDGLGFEEVNQASQTSIISGGNIYGTTGSFANLNAGNGAVKSNIIGSATSQTYGAWAQAGSFSTNTGSKGFVKFGTPFSNTNWYACCTPTGSKTSYEKWYISGVRNASGANFVGAASLRYDFIAFGT